MTSQEIQTQLDASLLETTRLLDLLVKTKHEETGLNEGDVADVFINGNLKCTGIYGGYRKKYGQYAEIVVYKQLKNGGASSFEHYISLWKKDVLTIKKHGL